MWGTVWQLQIAVWHYNHTKFWWRGDKLLLPASPRLWKMTGLTWVRRMGLKFLGSLVMTFSSWGHFIAFHCSSRSEKGSFPTSLPMCINDGHSDGLGGFRRDVRWSWGEYWSTREQGSRSGGECAPNAEREQGAGGWTLGSGQPHGPWEQGEWAVSFYYQFLN